MWNKPRTFLESSATSCYRKAPDKSLIFVISGPSGSGKTTLIRKLLLQPGLKSKIKRPVSFTTRPPRWGERNKKDYFFISRAEFSRNLKEKEILEYTRYLGHAYGTDRKQIERLLAQGKNIMLCLDIKGARAIKKLYPRRTITIFILPPEISTLRDRMQGRCKKASAKIISQRLKLARKEISESRKYDYQIVNDHLQRALKELKRVILKEIAGRG
jgi:guanylate kinase